MIEISLRRQQGSVKERGTRQRESENVVQRPRRHIERGEGNRRDEARSEGRKGDWRSRATRAIRAAEERGEIRMV